MPQIGSLFVNLSMNTAQFTAATQTASVGLNNIAVNSRKTQFALTNLSFQLNDVVSGLASGQDVMRIFAQQVGQVFQAFQQGGGFKTVSRAIVEMITPTRVAVGVVAALAVGFTALAVRALNAEDRVRGFNVMLKGLGDTGKATGAELEAAAKRLKDVGLNTGEAMAAMQAARRAGIAPGQLERVTRIGQNLIPVLGENAPQQLVGAVTGGVESLGKLALQLKVVTAGEVEAARETVALTGHFSQLENWLARIEARVKGLNQEALSPFGKSMRDLNIAWGQMLDALSKTSAIKLAVDALKELAQIMTYIATLGKEGGVGEAGGALAGALSGAMIGKFFGWPGALVGGVLGAGVGGYAGAVGPRAPVATADIPGIDFASIVRGVIKVESSGNPRAVSSAGAMGLMQLMPGTAARFGVKDPFNPAENIRGGTEYLQYLLKHYNGNIEHALMAYNWGEGNLDKALKGLKEIPKGVRAYPGAVMAAAGASATGSPEALLDQANLDRQIFVAARQRATEDLAYQSKVDILAENAAAAALRGGGGARALARIQAEQEAGGRFRGEIGSDEARQATLARSRQFFDLSQARGRRSLAQGGEADRETTEQLQKQASLFGQSTREIDHQIVLLKIRQEAERAGLEITDEAVKAREEEAKRLKEANDLIYRQQQLMEAVREVGTVFENAFGRAFDSIADGTFRLRKFLGDLLKDLGKTLASSAFKRLLGGDSGDGSGGIMGMLVGKLFGGLVGGGPGPGAGDFGGGGDLVGAATGGRWRVGGSGAIDSQLVAFRASPGEMIDVSQPGQYSGGSGEVIHINLNPSEGWVAGVADQRIVTRSGQIIDVAVKQSQRTVQRNFAGMSAEAQARTA